VQAHFGDNLRPKYREIPQKSPVDCANFWPFLNALRFADTVKRQFDGLAERISLAA
jgi:hypothetical protein